MKNKILLATTFESAEEIIKWCESKHIPTATVEAEYGELCSEGSHATLAHHTTKYKLNPAPCVMDDVEQMSNGVIVVSHVDLDTLGGITILEGNKLNHPTFWRSESIIDTKGYIGVKEIPYEDELIMKAFLGIEKTMKFELKTSDIISKDGIYDITEQVYELIKILHCLLSVDKDSNLMRYGLKQFDDYLKNLKLKSLYQDASVRILKTHQPQHYLIHRENDIEFRTCITLNERTGAIILSDISEELNCCKIMQDVFGEKAGGQFRVAGTPRHKRFGIRDVKKLCLHLNENYNFSIDAEKISGKKVS